MPQLTPFLLLLSPLWAWFNVWLIRTIYVAKGGDYYSKQWHFWQLVLRAFVVSYVITEWRTLEYWWLLPVWWAYDWFVYPGIINVFALREWEKRGFFYVGRKGREDKHPDMLQKWLLTMRYPERNLAVMKGSALAGAIALAWWVK